MLHIMTCFLENTVRGKREINTFCFFLECRL